MIRKNVLNYKLNLENHSTKSQYDEFLRSFRPEEERCPFCHAKGNCRTYASYDRHIIDYHDGKIVIDLLHITRLLCSCGHTHAALVDSIVPYRQYSLPCILHILQAWFSRTMTLEKIQEEFGVSPQVLRRWKEAYGKHQALWLGIVRSRQVSFRIFLVQQL